MYTGPKFNHNDLIYGYDTGYNAEGLSLSNGHTTKGPAHTNLLENIAGYTDINNTGFGRTYGQKICYIPTIGDVLVYYCDYFNNHGNADGSGNTSGSTCCPNLFNYHGGSPYIQVSGSTSYTYSIIFKHSDNYTHPNFMYRYERTNANATLTEGGLYNNSRRTHLGDGWYHAWGTFTTQSSAQHLLAYSFLYNYGRTYDRFYVAGISIVENKTGTSNFIVPPQHMVTPVSHTAGVSTTESLINLKQGGATIDVQYASNREKGALCFDGTDDYIPAPANPQNGYGAASWEFVVKFDQTYDDDTNTYNQIYSQDPAIWIAQYKSNSNADMIGIDLQKDNGSWFDGNGGATTATQVGPVDANIWYHVVFTFKQGVIKGYLNGVLGFTYTQTGMTQIKEGASTSNIGRRSSNQYLDGELPVFKLYGSELSQAQVTQHFNAYKNRFNI